MIPRGRNILTIRNMVCDRCVAAVDRIFDDLRLPLRHIELGEVELERTPTADEMAVLREKLQQKGFELVEDRDAATIARIKAAIVQLVHHTEVPAGKVKLSDHLSGVLHKDFTGLSTLFSSVEGITIEHYFLLQRMERVKELVHYGELTFSEIAYATGFSSAAHLSGQFKRFTGMSPTAFREHGGPRMELDQVG
ncbi:MAG: helix-turn-helix domain-containing protein [Flavobacteriales bacterium]